MVYDLSRLGERPFENLCRALAVHVLGPGLQAFGDGPDGGREACFDGRVRFSTSLDGHWDGYGVLQAKYRRAGLGTKDVDWLRKQITTELDAWSDPRRKRVTDGRVPEYLIIVTNVRLSSAARIGGIDRIRTLLAGYAERLALKGWALWDANQLSMYLDAYPAVSARFAEFLTPGDVLAKTFATLDSLGATPAGRDRLQVGQGQPGNERAFQAAYQAAGGEAVLGEATSEVYDDGPGWIQHFAGGPGRGPAVICARYEHNALAVDAQVWDAIRAAGPDQLAAVGYLVVTGSTPPFIAVSADEVLLDGGQWGPGRLVRGDDGRWRWEPQVTFSLDTRERGKWTAVADKMDLRLRCAARMWWAGNDFAIDGAGHRRLQAALRDGPLVAVIAALATRFGLDATTAQWERTPDTEGYNDRRFASYRLLVAGSTGRTALGVWARFQLPDGLQLTVVSLVDLRVDFAALAPALPGSASTPVDPSYRPGIAELERFFAAAWATATRALPLAATPDPLAVPPAGPSMIELHIDSERASGYGGERVLGLLDILDLSALGEPSSQPKPWMSAAVTAPLTLDPPQVNDLVGQTLRYMASGFGFLDLGMDDS
jgi:hypothetical protein